MLPLAILYEDDHLIAVDKPSGELSVPGRTQPLSTFSRVKDYFSDAREIHRLDMGTSGVILFAKNKICQAYIQRQFERRSTQKIYYALCGNAPNHRSGVVELPLICDWPNRPRQMVAFSQGKSATTYYELSDASREISKTPQTLQISIPSAQTVSCARLYPSTGRSHQLRVHLAAIGHPILGDELYAPPIWERASSRLLLHAAKLTVEHPVTQKDLEVTAPCPFGHLLHADLHDSAGTISST